MNTQQRLLPTKRVEWQILILILSITVINYFDRSSISFAIKPIQEAFDIDNSQFGMIAAAFGVGYILMSLIAGLLVDRFGTIKVWPIAALIWSIATMLMGYSTGFWSLFFLRVVLGLAEAVHFPALLKTITDWLEPSWRTRCVSIGLLGVPLASVFGAPFLSYLIHAYSWQFMFVVLGFLGIMWVIIWFFFFRWLTPRHHPFSKVRQETEQLLHTDIELRKRDIFKKLFSSKLFVGNCLNYFIFGYTLFFALSWLPGYLQQTYELNIMKTGNLLIIPWASSSLFIISGGWLSDYIWNKTQSIRKARIYLIGVGMFFSGLFFLGTSIAETLEMDMFLLTFGLSFAFFVNAPIYSLNADLFRDFAGTAQGVMTAFLALSGIVSPLVTGWISQATGNFDSAIYLIFLLSMLSACNSFFFQRDT